MTERIFVIGDIHGCFKTLQHLLHDVCQINNKDTLVFVGDYVDKGASSKAVLDLLMQSHLSGLKWTALMGNHEYMMLRSGFSDKNLHSWMMNGAPQTLKSFNAELPRDIDRKYFQFISNMPKYYQTDKFIICHGGLNFAIENPLLDTDTMLWGRSAYADKNKIGGKRLIVGHTPVSLEKVKKSISGDLIMIDAGCVYNEISNGGGFLCAYELASGDLFYTPNCE